MIINIIMLEKWDIKTSNKADGLDNSKTEVKQHDQYNRVMSPTPVGIIKVGPYVNRATTTFSGRLNIHWFGSFYWIPINKGMT